MQRVLQQVRSGDWLSRERIRFVAAALLVVSAAGFLLLIATAHGGIDRQGRPIGTDFSDVYAAGTYVLDGHPASPFDPPQQYARERAIFGPATPFYGWHYPPYFLFIAGALAKMRYGVALVVWQTSTLLLYLMALWGIVRSSFRGARSAHPESIATVVDVESRKNGPSIQGLCIPDSRYAASGMTLLLALAYPAVFVNVGHGQNGFLTAALFGGALAALDRRPLIAGIMFGLLVYKPQFGLMIPLALIAGGRWRTIAAAAATVALLTFATTLAFGPHIWRAFLVSTEFSRTVVLEQGATGWPKIQSLFSWARMWGAPIPVAYALQAALTLVLGAAIVWLWRSTAPLVLKGAALCLAAILATPYSLDYDMMVLAPAIALYALDGIARGFRSWEKSALAALWLAPLLTRSVAQATLLPLGVPAMLAVFVLLLRRAEPEPSIAFGARPSTMAASSKSAVTTSPRSKSSLAIE